MGQDGRINLNDASAEQLRLIQGIDEARIRALLEFRALHGAFESWEEVDGLPGFDDGFRAVLRREAILGPTEAGSATRRRAREHRPARSDEE